MRAYQSENNGSSDRIEADGSRPRKISRTDQITHATHFHLSSPAVRRPAIFYWRNQPGRYVSAGLRKSDATESELYCRVGRNRLTVLFGATSRDNVCAIMNDCSTRFSRFVHRSWTVSLTMLSEFFYVGIIYENNRNLAANVITVDPPASNADCSHSSQNRLGHWYELKWTSFLRDFHFAFMFEWWFTPLKREWRQSPKAY